MDYQLRQLTCDDGMDVYEMLQEIPAMENGFTNSAYNKTFSDFKVWLCRQEAIGRGENLEEGMVPQTIYWLYLDGRPVGIGKLRHYLNDRLRIEGGNTGYGIRPSERGKGYASLIVKLLVKEAAAIGILRMLVTVYSNNEPSLRAVFACGGVVEKVMDGMHYIWIDCTRENIV